AGARAASDAVRNATSLDVGRGPVRASTRYGAQRTKESHKALARRYRLSSRAHAPAIVSVSNNDSDRTLATVEARAAALGRSTASGSVVANASRTWTVACCRSAPLVAACAIASPTATVASRTPETTGIRGSLRIGRRVTRRIVP